MSIHYTLAVDPPWNETGGGRVKRGADRHYPLLKNNVAIYDAMVQSEVWPNFEDTATLWMFTTANFIGDAINLMVMLGFTYVTNVVWVKANRRELIDQDDQRIGTTWVDAVVPQKPGLGQRVRMCHEHLLFGRLGKVPSPPPSHRMPSVIYAPRTKHSRKPDEAFKLVETHDEGCISMMKGGPTWERIEMFANEDRPGWTRWGWGH